MLISIQKKKTLEMDPYIVSKKRDLGLTRTWEVKCDLPNSSWHWRRAQSRDMQIKYAQRLVLFNSQGFFKCACAQKSSNSVRLWPSGRQTLRSKVKLYKKRWLSYGVPGVSKKSNECLIQWWNSLSTQAQYIVHIIINSIKSTGNIIKGYRSCTAVVFT